MLRSLVGSEMCIRDSRPRAVKPGYDTPGCDPAYTEKISCNFANAVYDQMIITRYGVTLCCNDPIEKWAIKKQLLDLAAIYDAELCKNTFDKCCPPCALVVTITPYYPQTCNPPTNVVVVLNIPPSTCLAPTNVQVTITLNPFPCICYLITITSPGVPCNLSLIHISEPTRLLSISYAVFCLKKKTGQPVPTH